MAKHKAATEITIVQEERSAFADFVDQYKWHGMGLLVAVSAGILWMQQRASAEVEAQRGDWAALYEAGQEEDAAAALGDVATSVAQPRVGAWAKVQQAFALANDGQYSEAEQALAQAGDAEPLLASLQLPLGEDGQGITLRDLAMDRLKKESAWAAENPYVFENPDLPDGAPTVDLVTSLGTITIGLYMKEAPLHCKNFIEAAETGAFTGTKFHRITTGGFIQGGDPNSRNDDPDSWGLGGDREQVKKEDSGLIHAAGVLAAAKKGGQVDSSGNQFYITASPQHQFDSGYVVYGKVVSGLEVVEEISNGEMRTDKQETPVELIEITSVKVNL